MIIYAETIGRFRQDLVDGIDEKLEDAIRKRMNRNTPANEMRSWRNSLAQMGNILSISGIPDDAGVALEYNIPYTSKRVDMIISGKDPEDRNSAVIIELKQWETASAVEGKDAVVTTFINNGIHEVAHPSYQAWSYAMAIRDFNADVQDADVGLHPCAYLHNFKASGDMSITSREYTEFVDLAPVFLKNDGSRLAEFIGRYIRKGDGLETVFMIDRGRLRPSKSLQDCLSSMMNGNEEFILLDSQKVIYETILMEARHASYQNDYKKVIVVRGGPGTGKSVLAVNLLARLTSMGISASYVSKNSAPRNVYNTKLKGSMKRNRVDNLFKGSGSFVSCPENAFNVLLADEAHRLNEKSGLFRNLGENQVLEIIRSCRLSVFFIDEDQRVTLSDIGTVDEIRRHASSLGADVMEMELDSQFRCAGSDGYLQWLDGVLDIRDVPAIDIEDTGYDFRVFDDPNQLAERIRELNTVNNRSRLVAGYCWDWISEGKNDPNVHDITIPEHGFGMSWNLGNTGTWAIDPDSVNEIGCIHTCQGLEFDYIGVIIGPDIRSIDGKVVTDATERARTDQSLRGLKRYGEDAPEIADRIIKNTYKVLMSRGMKGCYVYCTDKGFADHLRKGASWRRI